MNAEQKKMYFTETAFVLDREGFHAETILGGTLGVWLDDEPLCEVGEVGGMTYRGENISTPERLIEITVDGKITGDELEDFIYIQEELERISIAVETL